MDVAGGEPTAREAGDPASSLLAEGRTCWRREAARRVSFLIDGAAYFDALASAIERAERQVLIVGWDVHSRVALRRDADGGMRDELAELLDRCVRRRGRLEVYVLGWDFAMIYALEREALPLLRFGLRTHGRVRFRLDDRHPLAGSHHQKLVVVDDRIAFCGGLDVTAVRWDTPEHRKDDPRRSSPGGRPYGPFHDVQIAVDGRAAAAAGDLARERWRRATGEELPQPKTDGDPWPDDLEPDLRDVRVAIVRTQPAYADAAEVREVEALYLEAIRSARRTIYLESQYLTAARIGEALAERLREPDGPEVVVVTRKSWSGWLEESTMAYLSSRLVERLREADRHDRLRIRHPVLPGQDDDALKLHSKVMVVDDRLARVGSANLANRSMGLDSECDFAVESEGPEHAAAILRFRNRLLGEHLGVEPGRVADEVERRGSLVAAIDALGGGERRLEPLEIRAPEWIGELAPDVGLLDPERPIEFERLREQFLPEDEIVRPARRRLLLRVAAALALAALAAAWRFTPLAELVTPGRLVGLAEPLREGFAGAAVAVLVFAIAANLMLPVTALIVVSALVFGWVKGFAVAYAGALLASAAGYAVGAHLWRDTVRRISGGRLDRLSRWLGQRGVVSAITVRVVPVAPFAIVNLVAGASHIGARDFLVGTALGMAPGTLLLVMFADRALEAVRDPRLENLALLGVVALAFAAVLLGLRWLVRRRAGGDGPDRAEEGGSTGGAL